MASTSIPARTKGMLDKLDAAFAKAGRKRGKDFQIIITPPMPIAPCDEATPISASTGWW